MNDVNIKRTNDFKKLQQFITKQIIPEVYDSNVSMQMNLDGNTVTTGALECSGFFDHQQKVLSWAVGDKPIDQWVTTLIHEYCHFKQWKEQAKCWIDTNDDCNSDNTLDQFLSGNDVVEAEIRKIAFLEYDCEKRTAKILKRFPEIFNIDEYIQKSNAYIAFYKLCFERGKWYSPTNAPYLNEKIWKNMPTVFEPFNYYYLNFKYGHLDWDSCFEDKVLK